MLGNGINVSQCLSEYNADLHEWTTAGGQRTKHTVNTTRDTKKLVHDKSGSLKRPRSVTQQVRLLCSCRWMSLSGPRPAMLCEQCSGPWEGASLGALLPYDRCLIPRRLPFQAILWHQWQRSELVREFV